MLKKKVVIIVFVLASILDICIMNFAKFVINDNLSFTMNLTSNNADTYQIFYSTDVNSKEDQSVKCDYFVANQDQTLEFNVPSGFKYLRIDIGGKPSNIVINRLYFKYDNNEKELDYDMLGNSSSINMISDIKSTDGKLSLVTNGNDPYILVDITNMNLDNFVNDIQKQSILIKKILICIFIDIILLGFVIKSEKFIVFILELYKNRELIISLSINDFKTKYAGSYFGIIWAFIQPIVTIVLYWFVFQVGFRSTSVDDFPFVLWLVAGLVPWFFFSDGITYATNCLMEYSYLVKKVVFRISVLPMVKIISALFIHLFFICFMLIIFGCYGYIPTAYSIQILYYTFCIFALILAITYATSAIVLFFKDLGQIITILLQVGMWMSPIMWNISIIPDKYKFIFKLNPLFYIVEGYRDALINHVWFFEKLTMTVYFWCITGILLIVGTTIFRKLKPHFADVL